MFSCKRLVSTVILSIGLLMPFASIAAQKDMLILFSDGGGLSKVGTFLYTYEEFYLGKVDNPKRIDNLLKEGWSLLQIVPVNAKQHYWIFVK